jgi:hypothetical protein
VQTNGAAPLAAGHFAVVRFLGWDWFKEVSYRLPGCDRVRWRRFTCLTMPLRISLIISRRRPRRVRRIAIRQRPCEFIRPLPVELVPLEHLLQRPRPEKEPDPLTARQRPLRPAGALRRERVAAILVDYPVEDPGLSRRSGR